MLALGQYIHTSTESRVVTRNAAKMSEPTPERRAGFPRPATRSAAQPSPTEPVTAGATLSLAVSPTTAALVTARDRVRAFLRGCDVPERAVFDVVLSVEEACKNAIRFSGSGRDIDVTVAMTDGEVRLVVRDYGVGFEPRRIDVSRPPDTLNSRGRGLFLMTCLMDDLRIVCDHGVILTARKTVAL
jgi:anti-sigma regulatory factor (Ser/Thr protein kinase)